MEIQRWLKSVLWERAGWHEFDVRECMQDPCRGKAQRERVSRAAEFVIRCLANPECEGSAEVLDAIMERRAAMKRGDA